MMDILMSLPVVSYFLLPSIGTYSFSLNLLFFYLTWSTLILSHSPLRVELIGSLAIRVIFHLIPSIVFLLFDAVLPSLSVSIKLQGKSALPVPPNRRRRIAAAATTNGPPPVWQVALLGLVNILIGIALQGGIETLLTVSLQRKSALKVTTTLPLPWAIARDILRCYVAREVLQYYIHRFVLHSEQGGWLSRVHAQFAHAVTAPYASFTHYDHPLAWLLWRWVPVYLPAIVFRLHLLTYFIFLILVSLEETTAYSGYSSVPSILLGGMTKRQDLHMESKGAGNYGAWGLLDWIHGTSLGRGLDDDVEDEWDKHDGDQRVRGTIEGAKEGGRKALKSIRRRR